MTGDVVTPGWASLQDEAVALVQDAATTGITLRVVGSAGIRLHCTEPGRVMDAVGRPAKDLDFVVPSEHRKGLRRFLESRGYVVDRDLLVAMEGTRYAFRHDTTEVEVDVFVERLDFCHRIEVRDRMSIHALTLPIEELLLQKLQIVKLTVTDLMDLAIVLATHRVGDAAGVDAGRDDEALDARHIARLLARDWGFHHTASANLAKLADSEGPGRTVDLGPEASARVHDGIAILLGAVDAEPKTLSWRVRDKVGERRQWWQDVDDKEATY
jgi:hypothetical protein